MNEKIETGGSKGNSRTQVIRQRSSWECTHNKHNAFIKKWMVYPKYIEIVNIKTYYVLEFLSKMLDKRIVWSIKISA